MRVAVVIQARMSSSRFPEKVLADLCGRPMVLWSCERSARAHHVDRVVVATSTGDEEGPLIDVVTSAGFEVFRGDPRVADLLLSVGASPFDKKLPRPLLAAFTVVCSTLISYDASVMVR